MNGFPREIRNEVRNCMRPLRVLAAVCLAAGVAFGQNAGSPPASLREQIQSRVNREYPGLFELYRHLHTHPELSLHEEKTSERVAEELKQAGLEVTAGVGGYGVVGVLRNGNGPTVLVRTDLDALPVKEQTGLSYASQARAVDDKGNEVDVMHACGHDVHMSVFVGTARLLTTLKEDRKSVV